jgi:RHS repeat-associated protein
MARNQLANVRINNVLVASYLYDHRSLRGRKTLSHPPAGVPAITLYTYDPNGHLFQEIAGSGPNIGQALVTYLWQDDVPAAIVLGPNTPGNPSAQDKLLYLEVDHLNTPRIARDEQKRVVWRWDSDAFGNTAPNEDPDGDGIKTTINLRFPGQYFDAESGLHYNWHRYYDPQVGRYTQPDPIGVEGGMNPYAYVDGNPLSKIDPLGLWAWGDPLPQEAVDASSGLGDALLLGTGGYIRDQLGIDGGVDPCSDAYENGSLFALLGLGGPRLAYAGLAKAGSLLASSGAQASAFRAGLKTAFRGGVGRNWRPPNLAGKTDAKLRASAGKTNAGMNAYGAGVGAAGGMGAAQCGCQK